MNAQHFRQGRMRLPGLPPKSMAYLLAALAIVHPISKACAKELILRCDPVNSSNKEQVALLFISLSNDTVRWVAGKDVWSFSNRIINKRPAHSPPCPPKLTSPANIVPPANVTPSTNVAATRNLGQSNPQYPANEFCGCEYNETQFVHISNTAIEFGSASSTILEFTPAQQSTKECGGYTRGSPPYEKTKQSSYSSSIDKVTGISQLETPSFEKQSYQCKQISGNAF